MTTRGALGTFGSALLVGCFFGGCVSQPTGTETVVPEHSAAPETEVEPPALSEAEIDAGDEGENEPLRPPPWSPPDEPLLEGVAGAAQLLDRRDPQAALDHLAELGKLDTVEGEADLEPETREWFLAGAVAGRAYMELGEWELAVLALEPLAASKKFEDHLPPDIVGYELAKARINWAKTGLDRATADLQLERAIDELGELKRRSPDRIQAFHRAAQGEAMAALRGDSERAVKRNARKADKALARLVSSFPNHPEVGVWMLQRALAKERAGKAQDAAAALRHVHVHRAGEPEAERAWAELERLAETYDKIDPPRELSVRERLDAGQAARVLRRLDRSRELLEPIWADEDQPRYLRREAGHSLAWTHYKARDYDDCAAVFGALYEQVRSIDTRKDLSRCLERGSRYEEAVELWFGVYEGNKGAYGATALWTAIDLAIDGGLYDKAAELLEIYEDRYRAHGGERRWLAAWLPMRRGKYEEARKAFTVMVDSGRTAGRERAARYFLGKLEIQSEDRATRLRGVHRLQKLVTEGDERITAQGVIAGFPIYYGLMARQRLIEAGEDAGEPPMIAPLDWEDRYVGYAETREALKIGAENFGEPFSSLVRAEQLFAAGWREEASRELRVANDEFINGRSYYRGSDMPGTRSEALVAGLAWAEEWRHPRANPSRAARKLLRDEDQRAALRELFMLLSWAMPEPYRFGKLTSYDYPYRTRWHLRAYREPIERHAWQREVDPHHLWALMYTESRFRRHVVSWVGARGALQIMPWTGRQLVERLGEIEPGERFDPDILFRIEDNSRLATYYISELLKKFHGQPTFAYASYNGGPSNVARWLGAKAQGPVGVGLDEYIEEIPFTETSKYARRVMEVRAVYDLMYRGELPKWPNEVDADYEDNIGF